MGAACGGSSRSNVVAFAAVPGPLSPPSLVTNNAQPTPPTTNTSTVRPSKKRSLQVGPTPAKRIASAKGGELPQELGELIARDVHLLSRLGWQEFVRLRRGRGDIASLDAIKHPARRLLSLLKSRGAPVKFSTPPWSRQRLNQAIKRGPHKSCNEYLDFLEEEFIDMVQKGQWVVLPASVAKTLKGLRVSPPGVVPQRDRRPRWICDYTWSSVNDDTLDLSPREAMQFGQALDRVLREILLANPAFGPVHLNKTDLSDGFYRVDVNPDDIPKLGVVFPSRPGQPEPYVAFPLVLPMGWKESPPYFCAFTETIADVANERLQASAYQPKPHHLDELANAVRTEPPHKPARSASTPVKSVEVPSVRDPSLPTNAPPLQYIDIFVDDFISLGQAPFLRRVRKTLLHAIDQVIRPLDGHDSRYRREPVSMKKLRAGDCSWGTVKLVLGWIVDTVNLTIQLPPHREERLWEILNSIPRDQKRTSVKKWHKILGELRSMSVALPGSRNMFGRLQNALSLKEKGRVSLKKGVHQALDDFRWLASDLSSRPTRIPELVPLSPIAEGHHDASGAGAGGVWFPGQQAVLRQGWKPGVPILWRLQWPKFITDSIVSSDNPTGAITNSDLELAGGLLHLDCAAQTMDTRERTLLSKGDNLNTTFWERKGSTTTNSVPAYLLRMFGIHQRFHRYVPRFDYISGPSNLVADALSRDFRLSMSAIHSQLSHLFPQNVGFQEWTPPSELVSSIISALQRKQSARESLLAEPRAPSPTGKNGSTSQLSWASTPFSKPSTTKFQSYKSSCTEFVPENLQPTAIQSGLDRLKITYGQLHRRSSPWGPTIPATTPSGR